MPYKTITFEKTEHVIRLSLNRPQNGNAINQEMAYELADVCRIIRQDEEVRVVILTGAGDVFCSGCDFTENSSAYPDEVKKTNPANVSSSAIAGLNCPVIAAINGDALGAGLELALSCDIRICSDKAHLGLPETAYGLIPGGGGTQRLPRIVGKGKATEMIMMAEPVDAAEAYRIGLVSKVVPKQNFTAEVEEIAKKLNMRAPIAVKYAKEAIWKGTDMTLAQGLRLEADLSFLLQTTKDRAEGIKAFLDKRKATFMGE